MDDQANSNNHNAGDSSSIANSGTQPQSQADTQNSGVDLNALRELTQSEMQQRPTEPNQFTHGNTIQDGQSSQPAQQGQGGEGEFSQQVQDEGGILSQSAGQAQGEDNVLSQPTQQAQVDNDPKDMPNQQNQIEQPGRAVQGQENTQNKGQSIGPKEDPLAKLMGMVKGEDGGIDQLKVKKAFVVVKSKISNEFLTALAIASLENGEDTIAVIKLLLELDRRVEQGEIDEDTLISLGGE